MEQAIENTEPTSEPRPDAYEQIERAKVRIEQLAAEYVELGTPKSKADLDAATAELTTWQAIQQAEADKAQREAIAYATIESDLRAKEEAERLARQEERLAELYQAVGRERLDDLIANTVSAVTAALRAVQAAHRGFQEGINRHNKAVGDYNHFAQFVLGRRDSRLENANFGQLSRRVAHEVEQELRKGATTRLEAQIPTDLLPETMLGRL